MPANPKLANHNLDANQAIAAAFDGTTGKLKTSTDIEISGGLEVDIDAASGDNIALADAVTGNKATIDDNKLNVKDIATKSAVDLVKTAVDAVNTSLADVKTKLDTIHTDLGSQATATNQTSANTKLDTVNTNLGDVKTKLDSIITLITSTNTKLDAMKPVLRQGIDYDSRTMTLSAGNTVETWVHKLAGSTITKGTYTVTFTDSTRTVVSSEAWT